MEGCTPSLSWCQMQVCEENLVADASCSIRIGRASKSLVLGSLLAALVQDLLTPAENGILICYSWLYVSLDSSISLEQLQRQD